MFKIHIFLSVLLSSLLFHTVYGQNDKRLQLHLIAGPSYASRLLSGPKELREIINDSETAIIGYELGIQIVPLQKERLSLATGILFSRMGYSLGKIYINTGPDPQDLPATLKVNYGFSFLEIPIRAMYFLREQSRGYLIFGLSNYILLDQKMKQVKGNTPGISLPEMPSKTYNVGLNIGFGYNIINTDKFNIGVEPNFKYQLLHMGKEDTPIKRNLFSAVLTINTKLKI